MPGLLDFLDNEDSRMGMGLLMAGSRRSDGAGFGQRLGEGVQYVQAQQDSDIKRKIQQAQISNYQSEIEARKLATIKDARSQANMDKLMNGDGNPQAMSPGAFMPSADGRGPTMPMSAPQAQQGVQGGLVGYAKSIGIPDKVIQSEMAFNGGKGIPEMLFKRGTSNMKVANGYAYDENTLGAGFMPSLSTSTNGQTSMTQIGRDGMPVVSAPQGALSTFGAYKDMEIGLGAAAKVNLRDNPDGTKSPVSELSENPTLQKMLSGGRPTSQPMIGRTGNPLIDAYKQTESGFNPNAVSSKGARGDMQVMPGTETAPGFGVTPARDGSKAELSRVGVDYQVAMQDRYKDPALAAIAYNWGPGNTDMWLKGGGDFKKLPPETQSYVAQVLTRNGVNGRNSQPAEAPAGPPRYGMTNQQTADAKSNSMFGEKLATEQADLLGKSFTTANDAANDLLGVQQARKAVQAGAFQGSGAELKLSVAKFGAAIGIPLDSEKASNTDYLKSVLGQGLLEKAKTLGSNPSNADASRISDIVGSIGKDPQAMNKILDWREEMANRSITGHNSRVDQATQSGYKSPYDMQVKIPDGGTAKAEAKTPKPANLVESLPTPNSSNRGQRIRDTTTGKILISNGMQWKAE